MHRKIKPNLTDQEYKELHSSGSEPGKFLRYSKASSNFDKCRCK